MQRSLCLLIAVAAISMPDRGHAQDGKQFVSDFIDSNQVSYAETALEIWNLAEVGYQEFVSTGLLQDHLQEAGFKIETGVAGIPTAFIASYGSGRPVIGILAEFDALPGINQAAAPDREQIEGKQAGHACGHHLFGMGSAAAAIAVKTWMGEAGLRGTIRVYGTPAEEGGSGKVYMVREGLFDDTDVVITWHAGDRNDASPDTNLAIKSAKFRFQGVSAHAAAAPDKARSALDGVEAMNMMANMLREHVPQETRIHYVITSGGSAPNVVPDFAEVYYYVRHPSPEVVANVFDRMIAAATGAALGTGTTVQHEIVGGSFNRLPNIALSKVMDANLRNVGGIHYTPFEQAFATGIQATLGDAARPLGSVEEIEPFEMHQSYASSDNGDVSWVTPMAHLRTATWVPGTSGHSWQAVAAGGMSIGTKGMIVAAKTLARTALDILSDPSIVTDARAEFEDRRGENFSYMPLLGDRDPPLDYRAAGGVGGAGGE